MKKTTAGRADPAGFRFGIEHEVAFLDREHRFADFTRVRFADFQQIVDMLPTYADDEHHLRTGDAGIKRKRWYVEGFERFVDTPQPVDCVPKGIEIRTTIHRSIAGVIGELADSLGLLCKAAATYGYRRVRVSFNPFQTVFAPQPPLNDYELACREASPEMQTAEIPMLTYGPDLNVSHVGFGTGEVIDAARKLTAYSPYIVPFSFGFPFSGGQLWDGLSPRTYLRTGARPAALAFVDDAAAVIATQPSLTKLARLGSEVGRIEFKAFDSCAEPADYAPLLALVKGLLCDDTLRDRADVPDRDLHRLAARSGFDDERIARGAARVLRAADDGLTDDPDRGQLTALWALLERRRTPAHLLIERFHSVGALDRLLRQLAIQP
jgi:gamma-glutamyl:cysteine ligase YbdK (ATP-grasp superfamily)